MEKKKQCEIEARVYDTFDDSDENFYFIAGYTIGGFPYAITWNEAIAKGYINNEGESLDNTGSPYLDALQQPLER